MPLGAKKVEAWLLMDLDVGVRTTKHVEPDVANKKVVGWLQQSDHFVVVQKRHFYGLNSFSDEAGNEGGGSFQWFVGAGQTLTITRTSTRGSPKWICVQDSIAITDHITGEGWQTQRWELQSRIEPVDNSYFEQDVEGSDNG